MRPMIFLLVLFFVWPGGSRAQILKKSLRRMTGGDGVSAADSAASIKSFMTADGGSGWFPGEDDGRRRKGFNNSVNKNN
ncbi:MAG TPA: hypothetical protein VGS79_24400 [Puia sp.]|nr:hypothetical protein [Puia sp.]